MVLRRRAIFPRQCSPHSFLCVGQSLSGCLLCLPKVGASPSHSAPPPSAALAMLHRLTRHPCSRTHTEQQVGSRAAARPSSRPSSRLCMYPVHVGRVGTSARLSLRRGLGLETRPKVDASRGCCGGISCDLWRYECVSGAVGCASGAPRVPCALVFVGVGSAARPCQARDPAPQRFAVRLMPPTHPHALPLPHALEGKGPRRRPQQRLGRRLGAVTVGYTCL